jgi:hypothetical protein
VNQHRARLETARQVLTDGEFDVWFAKHYQGYGRYAGSLMLHITIDQFRYRLARADLKMIRADKEEDAA